MTILPNDTESVSTSNTTPTTQNDTEGRTDTTTTDTPLSKFIKLMPKIELHAHLNGCVRESTLRELAHAKNVSLSPRLHHPANALQRRSITDCFEIFQEIYRCVDDLSSLKRVTCEALEDFASDNVVYLELRSTPRVLKDCHSKRDYVAAVVSVMKKFEEEQQQRVRRRCSGVDGINGTTQMAKLIPRLILSINRAGSVEDANLTAGLAIDLFQEGNKYIVGLEIGGNPTRGDLRDFIPALQVVRNAGMKVSVHCGETLPKKHNVLDDETKALLQFRPDRLGHALFLPPIAFDILQGTTSTSSHSLPPIPVECCPTSNTMTMELSTTKHYDDILYGLQKHPHLRRWLETGYPLSISTDDPVVFGTNATREYKLVAMAFGFGAEEMGHLVKKSCQYIFDGPIRIANSLEEVIDQELYELRQFIGIK